MSLMSLTGLDGQLLEEECLHGGSMPRSHRVQLVTLPARLLQLQTAAAAGCHGGRCRCKHGFWLDLTKRVAVTAAGGAAKDGKAKLAGPCGADASSNGGTTTAAQHPYADAVPAAEAGLEAQRVAEAAQAAAGHDADPARSRQQAWGASGNISQLTCARPSCRKPSTEQASSLDLAQRCKRHSQQGCPRTVAQPGGTKSAARLYCRATTAWGAAWAPVPQYVGLLHAVRGQDHSAVPLGPVHQVPQVPPAGRR